MDKYHCEKGADSIGDGRKFSELSAAMQQNFMNYQVTLEIFSGRQITHDQIAEIFNRLNSGKPLGDNDKYYARMNSPILKRVNTIKVHPDLIADFNRFVGKIGTGKTRKGISDAVGAVLSVGTKSRACITTSYELNHRHLGKDLTAEEYTAVVNFFKSYFTMLHNVMDTITGKPAKKFGKLSGVLGLSICSWIGYGHVHPAIEHYTRRTMHDRNYEPYTFRQLAKGDLRNCQGDSVSRRLLKIVEQWELDNARLDSMVDDVFAAADRIVANEYGDGDDGNCDDYEEEEEDEEEDA